tara:strand:+ start:2941 stop:4101 length:1161 start_codon:yes stop_codon:yes gene_type:complete
MKKILFISTRFPYPIFGGDKLRAFDILEFLSKKNQVDLVCLGEKDKDLKKNLKFCKNIKVFHTNLFSRIANSIFSFLKLEPLQNGYYLSNDMKNYINNVENKYDTIICHLLRSAQYLPTQFEGKKILEITDLQSLAYEQLINQLSFFNPLKYIYFIESLLVNIYEKKIFFNFHNIVFVSKKDATEAKSKISKAKKLYVVGNAKKFASRLFKYKKSNNKIIFIGNIKFIPNLLACVDFAKNGLKKINSKYPKIKFHIIGDIRYLDKLFLSKYKNVIVHGKVKNLKNVIKNSICGLCNVKVSTGFQNKTLSYMSYGIPAILSINSFSNTNFKKNKEVLVFRNDHELVKNIFSLIKNKKVANQLSINSQKIVKKNYNKNKILSKYNEII